MIHKEHVGLMSEMAKMPHSEEDMQKMMKEGKKKKKRMMIKKTMDKVKKGK